MKRQHAGLMGLFFISGFAALLYQIVWQRTLFCMYGINIESVTVVVTAFMLGLGLGSLAGGEVSKRPELPVVLLFAVVEAAIGVYGVVSLEVFHRVGELTLRESPWVVALGSFLLVLAPTMLMGATLPLLTAHLTRESKNVGDSVGRLYCVNTFVSAFAALAAVIVLLGYLGQANTVRLAALLNGVSAAAALFIHQHQHRRKGAFAWDSGSP